MTDIRRQGFHTVKANIEEMEKKIRRHKRRVAVGIMAGILGTAVLAGSAWLYFALKEYTEYTVEASIRQNDGEATKYESFSGNILRYGNDGAVYADLSDNLIWNQAFEMQQPMADVCGTYAVIADVQGSQIYIMDTAGVQSEIATKNPIRDVCVASQGTIAVLTQAEGASYLEVYNKSGEAIAAGELHVANSGFPLDIALSNDAQKMAVSILDVGSGEKVKTTIAFYHFGAAGQNEIDNIVGSYSYANAVIPEIHFISGDRLIAFGDNKIFLFEGKQQPKETYVLELEKEVKSIFYNEDYFGLAFQNGADGRRHVQIYDMGFKLRLELESKEDYQTIEFLENNEICILDTRRCEIYTLRGIKKFAHAFDEKLYKIFSGTFGNRYAFIFDGRMEKARLK